MSDFPDEKNSGFRKSTPTEAEMLRLLTNGVAFTPAEVRSVSENPGAATARPLDALADARWGKQVERFGVEIKTSSAPRMVELAADQAESGCRAIGVRPMVFLPYLGEEVLATLEKRGVSGIDLCGNAVILGAGFTVWRSGAPNRYIESRSIQNPYRGDSSIFTRCFLLRPRFPSLTSLQEFALAKNETNPAEGGGALRLGTASKVVQALADDLIVAKNREELRLIDPQRLLNNLRERYRRLPVQNWIGKTPFTREQVWERLGGARSEHCLRSAATGIASAGYYGVLSGVERLSLYVDDAALASRLLQVKAGRAFANIELIEDRKNLVFFDNRREGDARWASPIQTWLELAQAGPREREAAEALARRLLSDPESSFHE